MPSSIDQVLHKSRIDKPPQMNNTLAIDSSSSINRTPPLPQNGRPSSRSDGLHSDRRQSLSHRRNEIRENDEALVDSHPNGSTGSYGSNVTDFFSSDIFQIVIHNPTTAYRFLRFCQSRNCGESMEFLQKVRVCYCHVAAFRGVISASMRPKS